jgi:DNA polymerase III delta prime subunit
VESAAVFGIDEARLLREHALLRPIAGEEKFFIIAVDALTREAQNALLKTLEDPTPGTYFFLLLPSAETLVLTLRSRLEIVRGHTPRTSAHDQARAFLAAPLAERLERAAVLAEALAKEKTTRESVVAFIGALSVAARKEKVFPRDRTTALQEIARIEGYARDRSASVKMLLEHLAIVSPPLT